MFRDFKEMFKNLREMQDQLWKESLANFPGSAFPTDVNEWQRNSIEDINKLVENAVKQSLELQHEWLSQWTERASSKKLKPKLFAELSTDAANSTQRWLDNQNQLWNQWLKVLRASGSPGGMPGFEEWEKTVQESINGQMGLLDDWMKMASAERFSTKEVSKLSQQIEKTMQNAIEIQRRLWSHWFNELAESGTPLDAQLKAIDSKPGKKKSKAGTGKRKVPGKSAQPDDDLKQISGIGPSLEKQLKKAGIKTFGQIAALSEGDIADLEERIVQLRGRIKRDNWSKQAQKLIT